MLLGCLQCLSYTVLSSVFLKAAYSHHLIPRPVLPSPLIVVQGKCPRRFWPGANAHNRTGMAYPPSFSASAAVPDPPPACLGKAQNPTKYRCRKQDSNL